MFLALGLLTVGLWLIFRVNSYFRYWKDRGVPQISGSFPCGTWPNNVLSKRYHGYNNQDLYNALAPHPYGGYYHFIEPRLLLRDPELIQHVMIKDFSSFRNRFQMRNETNNIVEQHLFALEGDKWRALRVKLTPTFTSGKLKNMFSIFDECSKLLTERIDRDIKISDTIDVKELMSRFTLEIIVTCAFGLELNALQNENNFFFDIGRLVFPKAISTYRKFTEVTKVFAPTLFKRLPSVVPGRLEAFLTESISSTIDYREKNNLKRNDFLDLLIDLKNKGSLPAEKGDEQDSVPGSEAVQDIKVDLTCIVAQCFVFFLAGYETSSSVQTNALFELAVNQDIQANLRQEIKTVLEKTQGRLTCQAVMEMKYLDQVVKETMRKYPTIPILTRMCVKKYKMPHSDLVIDEGTQMVIPVYALHHDPDYFPEPDKFNPERFSDDGKIRPGTYMPFGDGPRLCIGMRFGLLQTKMGLISVLRHFKVSPTVGTVNPMQFSATMLVTTTKHPVVLKFEKI